ncbi:MAG: phosphatidylglycerophosphatase A [candidate division KSB1 bacterium]|nr:phosphatidylglycerophosphatase A [candidate division KSB1 bacterium]
MLSKLVATGLGTGFSPVAPGTAGSLFILVIYGLIPEIKIYYFLPGVVVLFFVGVGSATQAEKEYGPDASVINIDEIVGMLITLMALEKTWLVMAAGFFLFRLFDVVKLFPIDHLQKLPRGWGIMMDDVVAAVYANLGVRLIWKLMN